MSNTRKREVSVPESTVFYGRLHAMKMEIIDGRILDLMRGPEKQVQRMLVRDDSKVVVRSYDAINEDVLGPFSRLSFDEMEICEFATKYGNLAETVLVENPVGHHASRTGEKLSRWLTEIDTLKETYQLYSSWRRRETSELENHIKWKNGPIVRYESKFHTRNLASPALGGLEQFQEGDVYGPAIFHVQTTVNSYLHNHTATHLYWGLEFNKQPRFKGLEPGRHAPSLFLIPKNLLGAIWLQFAKIIDQRSGMQRCPACRGLFAKGGGRQGARRNDARFCSRGCRWRRRKIARDRYREGWSVRDISRELSAEFDIVKRWVTGVRRQPKT